MGGAGRRLRAVVVDEAPEQVEDTTVGWEGLTAEVREQIAEAGRDGRLVNEIGALRVVMERLLAEGIDAARLATLLPRLVNAIVRAMQVQRALGGAEDDEFARLIARALAEAVGEVETDEGGADDDR